VPRIFDNIEQSLLSALRETLATSDRADFCVGYFNLRGWKQLDQRIDEWAGDEKHRCRLLVGMQRLPQDQLREIVGTNKGEQSIDNQTATRLRKRLADEFRQQLTIGAPSDADERGLRRLASQIRAKKVVVKLFLRHPLHAKLYLLFRPDLISPIVGFLGSSNLTFAGLSQQGELNVDVMDHDASKKLANWFNDRWEDNFCIDISDELAKIIDESWAGEHLVPPYHIYVKMAYHLSQEARAGLTEFYIPADFQTTLLEFQKAAVQIAAHHLNKRGGVIIGDVVGLGKTLMAAALAKLVQETQYLSTLIICPKNLTKMWQAYVDEYGLQAKILPISTVARELSNVPARFRLVLIDESHNLRNRAGQRYNAIREYIAQSNSKVILLSATPYNKTYLDLSSQLRLFVPVDADIGIRPERIIKEIGETEFIRRHQCPVRSLAAFEKSEHPDDWRELMRLYLVRRTRSFIRDNYGIDDPAKGRKYLEFQDQSRCYFPIRQPKTVKFKIDERRKTDQYARLYAQDVVDEINRLELPRYGMGLYVAPSPRKPPSAEEAKTLDNLSRAGKRLMGFCRTNLFKRLESSGDAFIQSIERHVLRNYIFLYAIESDKPIPIGTQDMGLLDLSDEDEADTFFGHDDDEDDLEPDLDTRAALMTDAEYRQQAEQIYAVYARRYTKRFKWLRPDLFVDLLTKDLKKDAGALIGLLKRSGAWDPTEDAKLAALVDLLANKHPTEKVLIFSQFADTVEYLQSQLVARGIRHSLGVTGDSADPTAAAWRFSPISNNRRDRVAPDDELRVLVATDVLSEGQNLQDCSIIVNYDLPWAIIRLIQRAGRVDRIGQQADKILCYSFLPADGVERVIRLRARVRQRLTQNAEVVGSDESFFEDESGDQAIRDLFTERAGLLDGEDDAEVDLASYAYQIWKNAIEGDPKLENLITALPAVSYATRFFAADARRRSGSLVYMRTAQGNDALAWIDVDGNTVTESQFEILKAAECKPDTPAQPRLAKHHELVQKAVELIAQEERSVGGQLGRPSGARFRTYERLRDYVQSLKGTLYESPPLLMKALDEIYRFPLTSFATDTLNRQLRGGISEDKLAEFVLALREEGRLCHITDEGAAATDPQIICSMGLAEDSGRMGDGH